jgi:aerobic carbon-monoxide dehydrogenase large subunit
VPVAYDSGDYPKALSMALDMLGGVEAFRKRQATARTEGRRLGLGIGCYTEGTGIGPFEGASIRIDASGKVLVVSGIAPQGQGMETVLSQLAADAWKVKPDDVVVTLGDTAAIARGFGTIASRSTVTASAAMHFASEKLRARIFEHAAEKLECSALDLELRDGAVGVVGVPGHQVSLADVAREAGDLQETHYFEPPTVTWAYAVHAAIVDIDTETGVVRVERYVVVHDCGTLVNPLLAEGQIAGGVIQGIHGALSEAIIYDDEGQLLTGTLMDYALPVASTCPPVEIGHLESPSPHNPLGVKGLGEGGAIAPPAAISNAVSDALGIEINDLPVRIWNSGNSGSGP